jgi:identified by metaGeneAnnotator
MNQEQTLVDKNKQELIESVINDAELLEQVLRTPQIAGVVSMLVQQQVSHSGPLPMASEMKKYDEVIPNGADRIMKMAENEQKNRYAIPKWSLFLKGLGLCFGMASVSLVIWFCFELINKEQYSSAVTVMCVVLVALASVFAIGKVIQKDKPNEQNNSDE